MEISLAKTIETHGVEKLNAATGIPVRTLYRWAKEGVPGNGVAQDWRLNQIKAAIEKLDGMKPKAKASKRKAAA